MTSEQEYFAPSPENHADLRRAFGCFGTGVTVVTIQTADGPLGMTANSFSSVSLTPALVLWSPALAARRHDPFAQAEHFCIHILGEDQLALARHFATNGDGFDAFDWSAGPLGAPRLAGCLAEFHCTRFARYPAGDHSLILGEIQQVFHAQTHGPGLLFKRGQFGRFTADA
ncbi:FMN reductase (NADH) NtaB [Roseobacter fucihabitans]|uniref:FMN reductase (NADH) NtaB n=1 Tax=Roseobacter fucihabitans TaxID=1537242 RepID=A0ABZ2BUR9_9RHOB|nr:flavin reductase family protein [Roseobacter litoralis]MBC6964759.1 FMN reductase (NADH) NtaB [Roseobacter litoralis]